MDVLSPIIPTNKLDIEPGKAFLEITEEPNLVSPSKKLIFFVYDASKK
jgi:hypothetical protein